MMDYYDILGVSPTSEPEVIRAAYRAMMRKYHPDTNLGGDSAEKARLINEAYETLIDPYLRGVYDGQRAGRSEVPPHRNPVDDGERKADRSLTVPGTYAQTKNTIYLRFAVFLLAGVAIGSLANYHFTSGLKPPQSDIQVTMDRGPVQDSMPEPTHSPNHANEIGAAEARGTETEITSVQAFEAKVPHRAADLIVAEFSERGMSGVISMSQRCHATTKLSVESVDLCVSIDELAREIDDTFRGAMAESGSPMNSDNEITNYFSYRRDANIGDYERYGMTLEDIERRIQEIRTASKKFVPYAMNQMLKSPSN